MRIVFAGGGTGGHIYPALAIAERLVEMKSDTEILFMVGTKGMEKKIVSDAGYEMKAISVMGMPRKFSFDLIPFFWKLSTSIIKSRKSLKSFKPSIVMATGGYVSGPPVIAARLLSIPVMIQEQNSYPGLTNRKLSAYSDIVCLGFGDAEKYFTGKTEIMVTGNPVRRDIGTGNREKSAEEFGLDPSLKTVLAFGGSQGARAINEALSGALETLAGEKLQLIWQAGGFEYDLYKKFNGMHGGRVKVLPYIDDMVGAYSVTDLVVSRAGAMTIAEITSCGLPAVFIPLPTAAANHQEHNAKSLVDAGAAEMILERDLNPETLSSTIRELICSDEKLSSMAGASKKLGNKDAAIDIAKIIISRYGEN